MIRGKKLNRLKKASIFLLVLIISFIFYVMIAISNSKNMTIRQKLLKATYPALMWLSQKTGTKSTSLSKKAVEPAVPLYILPATLIDGKKLNLNDFKGKKILLVNTASDCGYTSQLDALEKLYQSKKEKLVVLGFPANDFKEQEKESDENIASFCKINFGVTFPLLKKSGVIKGPGQNEIFQWLTDKDKNGWNNKAPTWNFCKYLVDEQGRLVHFFAPSVDPLSSEVLAAIAQ